MDKYQALRDANTNGANFDLDTQAIIAHLQGWDRQFGIELSDVRFDAVTVRFDRLPDDPAALAALAADVYDFCPDTIDQHFGCVHEMIGYADETGEPVPDHLRELVDGVDLTADDYGLELLKRSLAKHKLVTLWWD
jgi:hypothetical protein